MHVSSKICECYKACGILGKQNQEVAEKIRMPHFSNSSSKPCSCNLFQPLVVIANPYVLEGSGPAGPHKG